MKKIAILQSNYIPWKGYFDIINTADEFILYDTAQFTKNDWRNRNKIKSQQGLQWLTIPVSNNSLSQTILDTKIASSSWNNKHLRTLKQNYGKAPYADEIFTLIENLYHECDYKYLSEVNYCFLKKISEYLKIETKISWSHDYRLTDGKTDRLVNLCTQAEGSIYISGPSAKNYLQEELFNREGITVEWMDYEDYPIYNQLYPPFEHSVSILDLLFNEGPQTAKFMKSFS